MSNATTAERPTIERLPDEHPARFQARVEYIVAGPERSLELVRQKIGMRSVRRLEMWSSEDGWGEQARRWDDMLVRMRTQSEVDAYRKSLVDYRDRYGKMGKAIFEASARLLNRLNQVADKADVGPATLGIITNAARMAADLEALALQIEPLLEHFDDIDRS